MTTRHFGERDIDDGAAFQRARRNPSFVCFERRDDGSGYWTASGKQITVAMLTRHPHWIRYDEGVIDLEGEQI